MWVKNICNKDIAVTNNITDINIWVRVWPRANIVTTEHANLTRPYHRCSTLRRLNDKYAVVASNLCDAICLMKWLTS